MLRRRSLLTNWGSFCAEWTGIGECTSIHYIMSRIFPTLCIAAAPVSSLLLTPNRLDETKTCSDVCKQSCVM